jgi:hypothetical protein
MRHTGASTVLWDSVSNGKRIFSNSIFPKSPNYVTTCECVCVYNIEVCI